MKLKSGKQIGLSNQKVIIQMYTNQYDHYPEYFQNDHQDQLQGTVQQFYDYNQPVMSNQGMRDISVPQIRQPNYMNYQMNPQVNSNFNQHYNPNTMTTNNVNVNSSRNIGSYRQSHYNYPQASLNGYNRQCNASQPNITFQMYQLLAKQFKLSLNVIKSQNNTLIQKQKNHIKKLVGQYKFIKDFILSDQLTINRYQTQKLIKNIREAGHPLDQESTFGFDTKQNQQFINLSQNKVTDVQNRQSKRELLDPALILENKIKKKLKQQKIKLQNAQENQSGGTGKKSQQYKGISLKCEQSLEKEDVRLQGPTKEKKSKQFCEDLPQYPQDFSGQQSFLVNQQIQEKERVKMLQSRGNKGTMGIKSTTNFKPELAFTYRHSYNQQLKKQTLLIQEFFDEYLCQKMQYASKSQFKLYKIHKNQLMEIYAKWKNGLIDSKQRIDCMVQSKIVQARLTTEFKRRFSSCANDRSYYYGVKFKQQNFLRMIFQRK